MWQKYYRIAERQLEAGKLKAAEQHILKALQYARESQDQEHIARSLCILGHIYMETDNAQVRETLQESLDAARQAFGTRSLEAAEQMELLSCVLEFEPDTTTAEELRLQALDIVQSSGDRERLIDSLDVLIDFYIKLGSFSEAEKYFLQFMNIQRVVYGPLSQEIAQQVDRFSEILKGLGRRDEAEELDSLVYRCHCCGECVFVAKLDQEIESILPALNATDTEFAEFIDGRRADLLKLPAIVDRLASEILPTDPFREFKLQALSEPERSVKHRLAQALYFVGANSNNLELLLESRKLFSSINDSDHPKDSRLRQYMLLLVDLANLEPHHISELEQLMSMNPDNAALRYTKALLLFRKTGICSKSRTAMKDAFEANPCVPLIFEGKDTSDLPHEFRDIGEEAAAYCRESKHQWTSTPGALEFMSELFRPLLRRRVREILSVTDR